MPRKYKKLNNKGQQSTLSYLIVGTIVMAVLIIIGPYAIRAVNTSFKALEDGVLDSFSDPLLEAPEDEIDIPGCVCNFEDAACGGDDPPEGVFCTDFEMLEKIKCIPSGCEANIPGITTSQCTPDPTCCVIVPGTPPDDCGKSPCQPDKLLSVENCGGTPPTTSDICIDHSGCVGQCKTPPPIPNYGDWCPGDETSVPLPSPHPTTFVDQGNCSNPPETPKCEFECDTSKGYVAKAQKCDCESPWQDTGDGCICPDPQIQTDCACQCAAGGGWPATGSCSQPVSGHCYKSYEMSVATLNCPKNHVTDGSGSCKFKNEGYGGGPPGKMFVDGPAPDGEGWLCAGQTSITSGSTCHWTSLNAKTNCIATCEEDIPTPVGIEVFKERIGCGGDLTTWNKCVTEACVEIGTSCIEGFYNCTSQCAGTSAAQTCSIHPTSLLGHLSVDDIGPAVYMQAYGCGVGLTTVKECKTVVTSFGQYKFKTCRGLSFSGVDSSTLCTDTSPPGDTAPFFKVGYLSSTAKPGYTPIYQEPLGCGNNLADQTTCNTRVCKVNDKEEVCDADEDYVFDSCDGSNCSYQSSQTCATTLVGYLVPPTLVGLAP